MSLWAHNWSIAVTTALVWGTSEFKYHWGLELNISQTKGKTLEGQESGYNNLCRHCWLYTTLNIQSQCTTFYCSHLEVNSRFQSCSLCHLTVFFSPSIYSIFWYLLEIDIQLPPWNQATDWHHFLTQIAMSFQSNWQLAISKTNSAVTAFKTSY